MASSSFILKYSFNLSEDEYSKIFWILFEILPFWIYLIEIILDLNTSYYSRGIYISNRKNIIKHYFRYNFLLDLLTVFPLFLRTFKDFDYLDITLILRLITCERQLKRIEEYLQLKGKKEGFFQLVKLIVNLLFLAHICACLWHYLGMWEVKNGIYNSWLIVENINEENWTIKYIYSLYFSIVTMMTVGYGDISAKNPLECLFNIFIIIFGCGVFGYTINNIGSIFKEMYLDEKEFR